MTLDVINPTPSQIESCFMMGWEYVGYGFFFRNQEVGFFTASGFMKE